MNRIYLDPMLKGAYPEDVVAALRAAGAELLVEPGDMDLIARNRGDFLGVNFYSGFSFAADPAATDNWRLRMTRPAHPSIPITAPATRPVYRRPAAGHGRLWQSAGDRHREWHSLPR